MPVSSQNLYVESLTPQCDEIKVWGLWEVIGFRLGHEDGAPMMGLVFSYEDKETMAFPRCGVWCWVWWGREGEVSGVSSFFF